MAYVCNKVVDGAKHGEDVSHAVSRAIQDRSSPIRPLELKVLGRSNGVARSNPSPFLVTVSCSLGHRLTFSVGGHGLRAP